MAKKTLMTFKKGDRRVHYFKLPIANYTAGGTLFFTAKPAADNDDTDSLAAIDKAFTDDNVALTATQAVWTLEFLPDDIAATFGANETKKTFKGEFQYVPLNGHPSSFPDDDNYIEVVVYADIKRATA